MVKRSSGRLRVGVWASVNAIAGGGPHDLWVQALLNALAKADFVDQALLVLDRRAPAGHEAGAIFNAFARLEWSLLSRAATIPENCATAAERAEGVLTIGRPNAPANVERDALRAAEFDLVIKTHAGRSVADVMRAINAPVWTYNFLVDDTGGEADIALHAVLHGEHVAPVELQEMAGERSRRVVARAHAPVYFSAAKTSLGMKDKAVSLTLRELRLLERAAARNEAPPERPASPLRAPRLSAADIPKTPRYQAHLAANIVRRTGDEAAYRISVLRRKTRPSFSLYLAEGDVASHDFRDSYRIPGRARASGGMTRFSFSSRTTA